MKSDPICANCGNSVLECQGFCERKKGDMREKIAGIRLRLISQSKEISSEGHNGWGNTMADAADALKAWCLWDELWESHEAMNYRQYTSMTGKECHEVIAEIKTGDKVHMAYGDSFADAVSQVWLLWKEDK